MKFSLLFLSMLLYLFSSLASTAEMKIYRWVDEKGKVHFSDTAVPGTQEIEVKINNLFSIEKTEGILNQLPIADKPDDVAIINYQATILTPQEDQTLRSNDGTINIYVSTKPEKENTQTLQLYLDGKKLGSPQISPTMRALNINRGTHQVQVVLLDKNGKELTQTQVVTIHLQRAITQ